MNEHITVLFIGSEALGAALEADAADGALHWVLESELFPALGAYLIAMPGIIVIDSAHPAAEDAWVHLRSVDAGPFVLLTGKSAAPWMLRQGAYSQADTFIVPASQPADLLAASIRAFISGELLAFQGAIRTG